ncbi:hypothetical protein SAMN02745208_01700, partial [Heyndrickxia coagulans DSM 1 = ATCC 7050]
NVETPYSTPERALFEIPHAKFPIMHNNWIIQIIFLQIMHHIPL